MSTSSPAIRGLRASKQRLHTTSFTCCAREHFVGSRARPLRAKDALRPPACGPALAGWGRRSGHIFACDEDATSKNVKVKPALSAIIANNMLFSKLILITAFLVSLYGCASSQRKQPQFKWGQDLNTVHKNEQQRLSQEPFARNSSPKADITTMVYYDNFMNSRCYLTYWFDLDSLQTVSYSCSNPDWDEAELKRFVRQKLDSLYGEPISVVLGDKSYDYYKASDAHIYFRMTRIHQNKELWRTFQANIFYSHFRHDTYKNLEGVLSTYGR